MTTDPKLTSDDFSLEAYKKILSRAISLDFEFPKVSQMKDGVSSIDKFLMLRHDIDISPLNALRMAKLEHSLGVVSSYYVLMHSSFCNPMAPEYRDALHEIVDLGFEVGLHYETDFFETRDLDPVRGVLGDVVCLETILDHKIVSISQHNPVVGSVVAELSKY